MRNFLRIFKKKYFFNLDIFNNQCPLRSAGSFDALSNGMFQHLKIHECELSSPSLWPEDYGPTVFNKRMKIYCLKFLKISNV